MGKYLKLFETHSEYLAFTQTEDFILPNVSYCEDNNEVHYNPYVDPYNGHAYVDLGLPSGTLWATKNVGANNITDSGLYFSWGGTTGYTAAQVGTDKNFNWADYELGDGQGGAAHMTKYNSTDGKTVLEAEDDAATVNMGGEWHMPSKEQLSELAANTKNGWVDANGVFTVYSWDEDYAEPTQTTVSGITTFSGTTGFLFFNENVSDIPAALQSGEYVFFPAAGLCSNGSLVGVGVFGDVWSCSVNENGLDNAWRVRFNSDEAEVNYGSRYVGLSVRGVVGELTT